MLGYDASNGDVVRQTSPAFSPLVLDFLAIVPPDPVRDVRSSRLPIVGFHGGPDPDRRRRFIETPTGSGPEVKGWAALE